MTTEILISEHFGLLGEQTGVKILFTSLNIYDLGSGIRVYLWIFDRLCVYS